MSIDHQLGEMFGHQVGLVGFSRNLLQRHQLLGALFLQPKAIHIDMANFGQAGPVQDALRRRGVELQANSYFISQVCAQGLGAQALAGSSDDPIEFALG